MIFDRFRLDTETESVWRDAEEIRLRPKAFAVLRYLAEHPRRLITKDELLQAVWSDVAVGEAALAVCVGEIRKVLGDDARSPRLIETVHRRGYRFIGATGEPATTHAFSEHPRTNVPRQLTSFIGRKREMERVKVTIQDTALTTLTGAGGVGKTRLAVEVASDALADFPHGVWLVDLAAISDPDDVLHAVTTTLGLREQPGRPAREVLLDYLRPKKLLLLLDNCEHLVSPAAQLSEHLLHECPTLRILATSREGLGVAGEALHVIPPLGVPPSTMAALPADLAEFEAVRLFVERAATAAPDFVLTERNAGAVAEICRRLDGIPLAVELAAARVTSMAVEEIAARIDDRFRLLTGGSRTALPRHQTLRGVLDWSHQLLTEGERILLRRLSAFAGGFTLVAAERTCAGGDLDERDIAELLARLVERSLVVFDQSGAEARYRLLETIRQYGQAKLLDSGDTDAIRSRHLDYYVAFAETADRCLRGPDQTTWLSRVDSEYDNLRSALGWSLTQSDLAEAGVRLAAALQWFWHMRGPIDEGQQWLERAIAHARGVTGSLRARALGALGLLTWRAGKLDRARTILEESVALARAVPDEATLASALHNLAHVRVMQVDGSFREAAEIWEESVARFRAIGDRWGVAWSLFCLGDHGRGQQNIPDVTVRLGESLELLREIGDRWLTAYVLTSLGGVAREQEDFARATTLLEESLAIWREAGTNHAIAIGYRELGHVALYQGLHDRAASLYRASLERLRDQAEHYETAWVLEEMAALALAEGRPRHAARILGTAEALRVSIGASISPVDRAVHDRTASAIRAALGDHEFETALADGRALSVDEAIEA